MKLPLDRVLATKPAWATFILAPAWDLWFDVMPPEHNGMSVGTTSLHIYPKARGVSVAERPERRRYPAYCLERHIVPSGAFCLGLSIRPLESDTAAAHWWSDLHHFLVLQAIAEQTGAWPSVHALSHGTEAAGHEVNARGIARAHGIEDIYDRLIEGDANWLAQACDGAAPPAGVAIGRLALKRLVSAELARRQALKEYWEREYQEGRRCCSTMNNCPLREREMADHADQKQDPTQMRARPTLASVLRQKDDNNEYSKQV